MSKNICIVAGARPNFIKISPIINAIDRLTNIKYRLVHTGQHYDEKMSDSFFSQLKIPKPHVNLNSRSGTQSEQTAKIMVSFEKDLTNNPVDIVLVVGDVNSTMACSIVAKKLKIKVAHVEAGIRSGDLNMPEEINRIITDSITDYFFTTSRAAGQNLIRSGIKKNKIFFVGNTMIDTLKRFKNDFIKPKIWNDFDLKSAEFIVLTLHRPSNVDEVNKLKDFLYEIVMNSGDLPIIFPAHPRTKNILSDGMVNFDKLKIIEPLTYLEFNFLVSNAKAVITDSGGITEETTFLGVPCMTLRDNTERPETISIGTNELVGTNPLKIRNYMKKLFKGKWKNGSIPELWDGSTSDRIVKILDKLISN